jgi:hypothetical protein
VKLLQELKKQVEGLDTLRHAWFTSFTTDIEFVETYVLPVTLGANTPRNRLEYEELQQELTRKKIDFRVFCDPRFLETHRIKRTCIPVHGVRPQRRPEWFSEESLFHPKVIYLEDCNGKRVIGAGSANLTISGWGRNLEAFQFFEVKSRANYREIRAFFASLCSAVDIRCTLDDRRKFPSDQEAWRFVHSYQDTTFPEQLLSGAKDLDLAVWSPYLPRDLAAFIERLEGASAAENLRIQLVADRVEGKLRTKWGDALAGLKASGRLAFYENPVPRHQNTEMCHAKIWKVPGKLAVGSWNFTGPGSNSMRNAQANWSTENNVEAGFIIDDRHSWRDACGAWLDLGEDDCASQKLLEQEELKVDDLPPFDLHVSFDWHSQSYDFQGKWLDGRAKSDYQVRLPGVRHLVPLAWTHRGEPVAPGLLAVDDKVLLRDRVFQVLQGDKECQRGLVSELNAASRRAQHFESLIDLFEALVQGDDAKGSIDLPFRTPLDSDSFADEQPTPEDVEDQGGKETSRGPIGYFKLFQSIRAYKRKLSGAEKLEQLEQQVFSWPGCLLELTDKAREELAKPGRDVFHWFLGHEVRWLCECADARRRELMHGYKAREPQYKPVPKERWESLHLPPPVSPPGVRAEYLAQVQKQWGEHA